VKTKKYTVEGIEKAVKNDRLLYKNRRGAEVFGTYTVEQMRSYTDRVEFLLKEIKRLQKKIDRLEKKE